MTPDRRRSANNVVSIDIDNVIANTDLVIRGLIKAQYGIVIKHTQIKTWNYSESVPISVRQEEKIFHMFHNHYCLYAPLLPYARRAISNIAKKHYILLVTARPIESDKLTKSWLNQKKIYYDSVIYTRKKSEISIGYKFFVEDNGETALLLANKSIPVILLNKPWNNHFNHSNIYRVGGWKAALKVIESNSALSG